MLYASLIAVLVVAGLVLMVLFLYVNSVMRFVLFDSVVAKECRIREELDPPAGSGTALFCLADSAFALVEAGLTILIGIPAGFAFMWAGLKSPKNT